MPVEDLPSVDLVVRPGQQLELIGPPDTNSEISWDGGPFEPPAARHLRAPAQEGDTAIAVRSQNAAGTYSAPRRIRLRVDNTPPRTTVSYAPAPVAADGKRWLPSAATATIEATDSVAGVAATRLRSPRSGQTGTDSLSFQLPSRGGEIHLEWDSEDRVGNRSEREDTVWVDARPPQITLGIEGKQVEANGQLVTAARVRPTAAVDDDQSGLGNNQRWLDERPVELEDWGGELVPGPHHAQIEATDRVGNRASDEIRFVVDGEAPSVSWSADARQQHEHDGTTYLALPLSIQAGARDDLAGVAALEWSTDRSNWQPLSSGATGSSRGFALDQASVWFRSRDRVGNQAVVEAVFPVDAEGPTIDLVTADGRRHKSGGELEVVLGEPLRAEATDDGVGIGANSDGLNGVEVAYRHRGWYRVSVFKQRDIIKPGNVGTYFLFARAVDRFGNETRAQWTVQFRRTRGAGS